MHNKYKYILILGICSISLTGCNFISTVDKEIEYSTTTEDVTNNLEDLTTTKSSNLSTFFEYTKIPSKDGIILKINNNSNLVCDLNITIDFYDKSGKKLKRLTKTIFAINEETKVKINNAPSVYDIYEVKLEAKESINKSIYVPSLKLTKDKSKVYLKGTSKYTLAQLLVTVIFYNSNNEIIYTKECNIPSDKKINYTFDIPLDYDGNPKDYKSIDYSIVSSYTNTE